MSGSIEIIQGSTKKFYVYLTKISNSEPLDLSDATQIEALFHKEDGSLLTLNLSSGISVTSALGGKIQVSLSTSNTEDLKEDERQDIEIVVTLPTDTHIVHALEKLNVYSRLNS